MSTSLTKYVAFFAVSLGLGASGCGGVADPAETCPIFCEKSVTCQSGATDQATCESICLKQAEDEAYAEALDLQSECYAESTCEDIKNRVCDPQDVE